jgi:hypothetical protein
MSVMMKSINSASRSFRQVMIVGSALLYAALLVMSTGCVVAHAGKLSSQHHHHGGDGSSDQNALCAWTCQATTDSAATIGSPPALTAPALGPVHLVSGLCTSSALLNIVQSRAPPSNSFVRLG